jgi:branched-chain amino acid transport system permease protein
MDIRVTSTPAQDLSVAASASAQKRASALNVEFMIGAALIVSSIVLPMLFGNRYWLHNFTVVNLFIVVAVFQNLLLADAGQVSFGQGAIFGAAAYMTGIICGLWGYDYIIGFVGGVGTALALGLLFAAPALRVQGYYLGFVTLSAAIVFPEMLVAFSHVTNGINGIARPVPVLQSDLGFGFTGIAILSTAVAVLGLAFHAFFRQTSIGRRMRVAAISPEAALSLGSSPGRLRSLAFVIASIATGIAGALYVPALAFVSPYAFRVDLSIFFFFAVIVGGSGRLTGPIIGIWILYLVPNALLADLANYRLLGYGLVALLIMLVFPDGLSGTIERFLRRRRTRSHVEGLQIRTILGHLTGRPAASDIATQSAIDVRSVSKAYGKMSALSNVSVAIGRGQIHAIVGPNGSGKTTLLNAISGFVRVDQGHISIAGNDVTGKLAYHTARLGVGRTFQTPRVFEDMTVWDNMVIGAGDDASQRRSWLVAALAPYRRGWEAHTPSVLPHAERRLLEVLRVLAMDPTTILLDEPAAGLAPEERADFVKLLLGLRDRLGKTVVLVEHDLNLVWQVADRITVLDAGQVVADGNPQAILSNPRVRGLFMGAAPDATYAANS